jgi:hypothetical protein
VAEIPEFKPKSSKGAGKKKSWPEEFVAEFYHGRKGAEENLLNKFLILP